MGRLWSCCASRDPPLLPLRAVVASLLLLPVLVALSLLPAPAQAFLSHSLRLASMNPSGSTHDRILLRTRRFSDPFFNFETLRRTLNLTHFSDPALDRAPPLPEEDFGSRPDLIKAGEIGRALQQELDSEAHVASVSLYFHVAHHHLQSYREALEVGEGSWGGREGCKKSIDWSGP